jgi:hypothetical protein
MSDPLRDALDDNRQRIVTQVLKRCGYARDSSQPQTGADPGKTRSGNHNEHFTDTENRLLGSGLLHRQHSHNCPRGCPSAFSGAYWRGRWRRLLQQLMYGLGRAGKAD